jgi:hypothetical protein
VLDSQDRICQDKRSESPSEPEDPEQSLKIAKGGAIAAKDRKTGRSGEIYSSCGQIAGWRE